MHALGIPTTRALCLIGSEEEVLRDQFYNGNIKSEKAAVVTRLAPTFLRFGSFELFYYRNEHAIIRLLANYVISHHFPNLLCIEDDVLRFKNWFSLIVERTAKLVSLWQSVGFGKTNSFHIIFFRFFLILTHLFCFFCGLQHMES